MVLFWFLAFPALFILLFGTIFSTDTNISDFPSVWLGTMAKLTGPSVRLWNKPELSPSIPAPGKMNWKRCRKAPGIWSSSFLPSPIPSWPGEQVEIAFYYDQQNQTMNQVLISSVSEILQEIERVMTGRPQVFVISSEAVQANNLRGDRLSDPGVLAMALMQLGLFGSMQIVGLRERKVLRQLT